MLISYQFKLVEETKAKYSIYNKDVYNFNKARFIIGKIQTQLVIIRLERRGRLKTIQPSNCEQVIVIAAINATSQIILVFLIFTSKYYLLAQYKEVEILRNQVIIVSNNSQIINKIGFKQLKHFIRHIDSKLVRVRCLLIFNSYESYQSLKF